MLKIFANLPKTTMISKYNPTPIFNQVKLLLTEENISNVEKIRANVNPLFPIVSAKINMTKLLIKEVECAMAL